MTVKFALACLPVIASLPSVVSCWSPGDSFPIKSRPDLHPQPLEFIVRNQDLISKDDGYVFMAPYLKNPSTQSQLQVQNAPTIYDTDGNLIYSAYGSLGTPFVFNVDVQQYNGTSYMTYFSGTFLNGGNDVGRNVLVDQSYNIVWSVVASNGRSSADAHVFNILPNGNALISTYEPTPYDLSAYGVSGPYGWLLDAIFQEVNIATNEVVFEWRASEFVPLNESYYPIGFDQFVGDGKSPLTPYDYFHLNSVVKTDDGNYLISARHTNSLYLVNGAPHTDASGNIIWKLTGTDGKEGTSNKFGVLDSIRRLDFNFSGQHDAQILESGATYMKVSLLDNAYNSVNKTSEYSSGLVIWIDAQAKTAFEVIRYIAPTVDGTRILTPSQGNVQHLSNGNVFIGWGNYPFFSEFTANGTCVMHVQYGSVTNDTETTTASYSVRRANWAGKPHDMPAIWMYYDPTVSSGNPPAIGRTYWYVSWNGNTNLTQWRFSLCTSGGLECAAYATVESTGYETVWSFYGPVEKGFANAIAKGNINGPFTETEHVVPYGVPPADFIE